MTQGEFFSALVKIAGLSKSVGRHSDEWIIATAKSQGLFIDEGVSPRERFEILAPLGTFISGAQHDTDTFEQVANAHLAWEAYQRYLEHRSTRIRSEAFAMQSARRHSL